jgi:hypothetical protein
LTFDAIITQDPRPNAMVLVIELNLHTLTSCLSSLLSNRTHETEAVVSRSIEFNYKWIMITPERSVFGAQFPALLELFEIEFEKKK